MGFQVIVTSCAPSRVRGLLTRYTIEIAPGVYVGGMGYKLADAVWKVVSEEMADSGGTAILVESSKVPQKFVLRECGSRSSFSDVDGFWALKRRR